jgi:hypothetical protein
MGAAKLAFEGVNAADCAYAAHDFGFHVSR